MGGWSGVLRAFLSAWSFLDRVQGGIERMLKKNKGTLKATDDASTSSRKTLDKESEKRLYDVLLEI